MIEEENEIQMINFPWHKKSGWKELLTSNLNNIEPGPVEVNCRDWILKCRDIQYLVNNLSKAGLNLIKIRSYATETIISAAALGYQANLLIIKE